MGDASAPPQIRIRQATPADAKAVVDIHFDAFGVGPMHGILNPEGVTEKAKARMTASFFPPATDQPGDGGEPLTMVAEKVQGGDGSAGEIVALAKWTIYRRDRTEAEWKVADPPRAAGEVEERSNPEAFDAFIGEMRRRKDEWVKGRRHLHLGILGCSSKYQRLGTGSALLRHGLELADAEDLPVFLESSPEGYRLYRRNGFEPRWVLDLEITQRWGVQKQPGQNWGQENAVDEMGPCPEGCYRSVGMERPAKSSRNSSN